MLLYQRSIYLNIPPGLADPEQIAFLPRSSSLALVVAAIWLLMEFGIGSLSKEDIRDSAIFIIDEEDLLFRRRLLFFNVFN